MFNGKMLASQRQLQPFIVWQYRYGHPTATDLHRAYHFPNRALELHHHDLSSGSACIAGTTVPGRGSSARAGRAKTKNPGFRTTWDCFAKTIVEKELHHYDDLTGHFMYSTNRMNITSV